MSSPARGTPLRSVAAAELFEIGDDGISFYPRVSAPAVPAAEPPPGSPRAPLSTGVAQLDALVRGGLPPASSTTLMGGTATGKTLLGLHFLVEGARQGEPGVLCTLEETPDQLREIACRFPFDFAALEQKGLVHLRYAPQIELSTDRVLHDVRRAVERLGARRVDVEVSERAPFKELRGVLTGVPVAVGTPTS